MESIINLYIWDNLTTVTGLKMGLFGFTAQFCDRTMKWNRNSVDPDQTAPLGADWSGSALFDQTLNILRIFMVCLILFELLLKRSRNIYLYESDVSPFANNRKIPHANLNKIYQVKHRNTSVFSTTFRFAINILYETVHQFGSMLFVDLKFLIKL